ncbi:hypothetical protein H4R18_004014 [Coemansia javaensis]|uniref:Amino acid transporter transmembrane domain-containing protein n=1 Tax=Coemansia javaensis TaxID=2761396 RepID=A0A9W8LHI1_9FUNG|nr:hypothetical protein H4R18_004014 [Coemansia javaensis]
MSYIDKIKSKLEKLVVAGQEQLNRVGSSSGYPGGSQQQPHPQYPYPQQPYQQQPYPQYPPYQQQPYGYGGGYPPASQTPYPPPPGQDNSPYPPPPPYQERPYPPADQPPPSLPPRNPHVAPEAPAEGGGAGAASVAGPGGPQPVGGGHNEVTFLNIQENELVHQRFLVIHGQVGGVKGEDDRVVVHHPYFPPLTFPVIDGYFKVLAELESGDNALRFEYIQGGACIRRGSLTVRMAPYTDKPPLLLAVIAGSDSQGIFDAPPDARGPGINDMDAAVRKFRCCAYLWQAFVAEQMYRAGFGRRTFNLEEYYEPDTMARDNVRRMTARVHVVRSKRTVAEIRDKERAQQWKPPPGYERRTSETQFSLAHDALNEYGQFKGDHYIACLTLDSHWDPELGVILGHAALGLGAGPRRLGVFGSHTTHAWPANAEEIAQKFLDTTKTDTRFLANDCNECGEYWRAANIGMGAFLHEAGHLFTLAHTPSGIMSRGFNDYNRAFMARAPNWKGPVRHSDEAGAHWHRTDLVRLRHHPCLRLPGDPPLREHERAELPFEFLPVDDGVVIWNGSGLTMIEVWVNSRYRGHVEYTAENLPRRRDGSLPAGPDEAADAFPQRVLFTSAKLHAVGGSWADSDKATLVLTSRATATHSLEDYEAFARAAMHVDRDGIRVFSATKLGRGELPDTVKSDALFSAKAVRASSLPKLRAVEFFAGLYVDGIVLHMADGSRAQIGKCRGGARSELAIDPDDDLDHIVVNSGWWIDGLEFVTVAGRRSGWKGNTGGGRTVLKPPSGYGWMGLSGSGAGWLDSLVMHYAKYRLDVPLADASNIHTFLNIICLAIGVGVLQLAYTVRESGWFGTAFIPLAAMSAFLNAAITLRCMYLKPGGGRIANYHDIGREAFGRLGYYTITVFNIVNIVGSVGIYAILAANNTSDMLAQVNVHVSPRVLMVAATAVMCIPTLFATTLAETLLVSLIGTATSVIVVVIVVAMACAYPIRDGVMHVAGHAERVSAISHHAVIPGGFSMALTSVTFAYVGTTIVPHLEGGMRRPEKFNHVFGAALAAIAAMYVVIAATGYWAYGDKTLSPITQNFPKRNWIQLAGLGLLLAFGMTVSGFGLVQTIVDIVAAFKHKK